MRLSEYGESLAYDAAFWSLGVSDPGYPLGELGKLSLEVSDKFRVLAIINLVSQGDSNFYYHNLIRSARARETYLRRLTRENAVDDHHGCSGRYESLLDAIAAGDLRLAQRIARLSPLEWRNGHEYPDDYCYAQIVHRLIQKEMPFGEFEPLFNRWTDYLDGDASARLKVCRALVDRDQAGFDESFEALLNENQAKILGNEARPQLEDPGVIAKRRVFVEGLAHLRLAELHGLATQPEYLYCPSLARVPMTVVFPGE